MTTGNKIGILSIVVTIIGIISGIFYYSSPDYSGGDVTIKAGDATEYGDGGDVTIKAGDASEYGNGGDITIRGGDGGKSNE